MHDLSLPQERQRHILDRLARDGRVLAGDLARDFATSEDTVRRDLRELAAAGLCRRVYGGALLPAPASVPLAARLEEAPARKAALAAAAVALVQRGQVLFLDAGSTNHAIALALPGDLDLTIVTNAPVIAAALSGRADLELIVIGGRVDPRLGAALGANALRDALDVSADLAFVGACALDAERGLAAFDVEEAAFKRAMAQQAGAVVAVVTSDKLGASAPFAVMPSALLAHVVVEADASADAITALHDRGLAIHRAAAPVDGTKSAT